jgi:hypothetical protein
MRSILANTLTLPALPARVVASLTPHPARRGTAG